MLHLPWRNVKVHRLIIHVTIRAKCSSTTNSSCSPTAISLQTCSTKLTPQSDKRRVHDVVLFFPSPPNQLQSKLPPPSSDLLQSSYSAKLSCMQSVPKLVISMESAFLPTNSRRFIGIRLLVSFVFDIIFYRQTLFMTHQSR